MNNNNNRQNHHVHPDSSSTEDKDNSEKPSPTIHLDRTNLQLIDSLLLGRSSRETAKILNKPVSTIQRRARLLVQHGVLKPTFELRHSRIGLKKGFLHVYLDDGSVSEMVDKLLARDGIYSASAHIGNSDVIGMFVYKDSRDILDLIEWTKHQDGVERVVWSEEVYAKSTSPKLEKMLATSTTGKVPILSSYAQKYAKMADQN